VTFSSLDLKTCKAKMIWQRGGQSSETKGKPGSLSSWLIMEKQSRGSTFLKYWRKKTAAWWNTKKIVTSSLETFPPMKTFTCTTPSRLPATPTTSSVKLSADPVPWGKPSTSSNRTPTAQSTGSYSMRTATWKTLLRPSSTSTPFSGSNSFQNCLSWRSTKVSTSEDTTCSGTFTCSSRKTWGSQYRTPWWTNSWTQTRRKRQTEKTVWLTRSGKRKTREASMWRKSNSSSNNSSSNNSSNSSKIKRKRQKEMCSATVKMSWRLMGRAQAATAPIPPWSPVTKTPPPHKFRTSPNSSITKTKRNRKLSRNRNASTSSNLRPKLLSQPSANSSKKHLLTKSLSLLCAKRKSYKKKLNLPKQSKHLSRAKLKSSKANK